MQFLLEPVFLFKTPAGPLYRIIEEAMDSHKLISLDTDEALSIIKEVDRETRRKVREQWEK